MQGDTISLLELNRRISRQLSVPSVNNVWVTAELLDVGVRGGHCYMELVEKDGSGAAILAKARAVVWNYPRSAVRARFHSVTGREFSAGIKVMVCVSTSYHPVYGLSLVVSDVNPDFTMGDLLRRRREIVERLTAEGILNLNRELPWPVAPQRIAVISAPGAAGYGDFINQLFTNPQNLRFTARLFPAVMQGDRTPSTIISALDAIASEARNWDIVVIIRGGGATSDLAAFEDYDLAAHIAQFPLPVVIGIGHERDVTLLDYVANYRVKTPTAAAELLIGRNAAVLEKFLSRGQQIHRIVKERMAGAAEYLAYIKGLLPTLPVMALERGRSRLNSSLMALGQVGTRRLLPEKVRLDNIAGGLPGLLEMVIGRQAERLDQRERLIEVLSPEATLRRGYSITRVAGHAITSASVVSASDIIETVLADGILKSKKVDN